MEVEAKMFSGITNSFDVSYVLLGAYSDELELEIKQTLHGLYWAEVGKGADWILVPFQHYHVPARILKRHPRAGIRSVQNVLRQIDEYTRTHPDFGENLEPLPTGTLCH